MKILFSADEHLCLRRKGVPKDWEINRFKLYHEKIAEIIKNNNIDVLIHGGDFFDREPTLEEASLAVSEHFNKLDVDTFVIDGNHEASKKGLTFLPILMKLVANERVKCVTKATNFENFDVLPYCELKKYEAGNVVLENKSKILITHVRGEIPPHVKPEVDLSIFDKWQLVLAGDLHDQSNSQRNIVYPGSPMTTHAYRGDNIKKGVIIVDSDTLKVEFIDLNLPKLLRRTVASVSEAVQNGVDYIDYEIVMPELLQEYTEVTEVVVRTEKTRVDALSEVLSGNPLKEQVINYYVDVIKTGSK